MKIYDSPIIIKQEFNKPIKTIWEAIIQINHMKQWFFESIPSFKPEVGFETQFDVNANGKIFTHLWKLTEVIDMEKITYKWRYDGFSGDSFVTFELNEVEDRTQLILTHQIVEPFPSNIPEFSRKSCSEGWDYFIRNSLKEYVESI